MTEPKYKSDDVIHLEVIGNSLYFVVDPNSNGCALVGVDPKGEALFDEVPLLFASGGREDLDLMPH